MSDDKMPEWFYDLMTQSRDYACASKNLAGEHERGMGYMFSMHAWEAFCKPENLAKIPEVKALIEALKHYEKTQDISQYIAVHSNFKDNCVAKEALKTFKDQGGSDE